ncbi:MAG: DUF4224 domain-containing protein [Nevskiaceae bacterium]|nr:MAG: DUF4224 domain-containing protein [Nevskiaceae bacterium]TAM22247.1 MAG: DUF4224 domain-containing protein [Nevskiaceae bacterium]
MFLTKDDIVMLTGTRHRSKQINWLRNSGIRFWVNVAGTPVVARSAIEGTPSKIEESGQSQWQPNALKRIAA